MKIEKIAMVPKITKVEWDLHRLNINEEQLKKFYLEQGLNYKKIFKSHKEQKQNLEKIKKLFKNLDIIKRNDLNREIARKYDLIISFGGDNHFQFVSHFLEDNIILGINSDPERSEGALTSINCNEISQIDFSDLEKFKVEQWTRLETEVDGKKIKELAISEIFIGEKKRHDMSRHILNFNTKSEEQKGSGLIITTGTGSSGWYNSSCRYLFEKGDLFSKTQKEARFLLSEPYDGKLSKYKLLNGRIKNNEFIEVTSLSDSSPYLTIDSLELIDLREGAKVRVFIGKPLRVLKIK